jgi:hypothetical protein
MYPTVLVLHSWLRWIVLVAAVAATVGAAGDQTIGVFSKRADRWGLILTIALDVQLLLGLLLYLVLSPFTAGVRANVSVVMRDPTLRFWNVEHLSTMLLAIVLVHLGRVIAKKAATPESRRRRLLVCFGLATVLIFAGMPWPGSRVARPLFRLGL